MKKLILLVGESKSGKTTEAQKIQENIPKTEIEMIVYHKK